MTARITQGVVESAVDGQPRARTTQAVTEAVSSYSPAARATQAVVESVNSGNPYSRISQTVVEVICPNQIRITQEVAEVVSGHDPSARISQEVVEVVCPSGPGVVAGIRSFLAPWLGGASSPSLSTPGYRSLLAPWIGGASAPGGNAGYRSLIGFWLGGVSSGEAIPPVPPVDENKGGFWKPVRERGVKSQAAEWKRKLKEEKSLLRFMEGVYDRLQGTENPALAEEIKRKAAPFIARKPGYRKPDQLIKATEPEQRQYEELLTDLFQVKAAIEALLADYAQQMREEEELLLLLSAA